MFDLKIKFKNTHTSIVFFLLLGLNADTQAFGLYQHGGTTSSRFSDNLIYGSDGTHYDTWAWVVGDNDKYLTGDFKGDGKSELIGLNDAGGAATVMNLDTTIGNGWSAQTVSSFYHFWSAGVHNHLYTTGDFNGDGKDNVLKAEFSGTYKTYEYYYMSFSSVPNAYLWVELGAGFNGDINRGDKLISGDFDGDGKTETMLIKYNDRHFTMKFSIHQSPNANPYWNWDIISSGNNSIANWYTSWNDQFVVGDFNGNGRDEILAINPSGQHHTMSFDNNRWTMIEGDSSGIIGGANIGWNDRYISEDFDGDGRDEIILVNPYHPWSLRLGFANNRWYPIEHNQGDDHIANWINAPGDYITSGDFDGDGGKEILQFNTTNAWQTATF